MLDDAHLIGNCPLQQPGSIVVLGVVFLQEVQRRLKLDCIIAIN